MLFTWGAQFRSFTVSHGRLLDVFSEYVCCTGGRSSGAERRSALGGTAGGLGGGGGVDGRIGAGQEPVDDPMIDDLDASPESSSVDAGESRPPRANGWPRESSLVNELRVNIKSG